MHTRRDILQLLGASAGASLLAGALPAFAATPVAGASTAGGAFVSKRPPKAQRRFISKAVEQQIAQIKAHIAAPELAWLFENCYPNTLDTTVETGTRNGKPDTFVITGDIHAMWLRDSSAQVHAWMSPV
ncbi:glycoside hydrolase family 125 protein, partial [Xanthomonas fragariae]|uniref:glycoside hydrolase family 125 protein n=1 Tax=Xanthomonas fragariae TaxID=48664 RepID=UPI00131F393B